MRSSSDAVETYLGALDRTFCGQGQGGPYAQADPCNNPNCLSSKRVWPQSDVTAADQTHCCWNIALAVVATSWQRCAFTGGKHNHNKHSWTRVFTFQRGDASCSVWMKPAGERGFRGVTWQPRLAVVPRHCGSSSIRALNISLGLWRRSESRQLRWWAASLKVKKTQTEYLNQLWLKKLFDL